MPPCSPTASRSSARTRGAERCSQHYYDSRGVARVYGMSLSDRVWKIWRSDPDFSQRFTGQVSEDGATILATWEKSEDGENWQHDFDLTYTKVPAFSLRAGTVATRLPAQDLERARAFYAEKLGLEPSEERPGGLLYRCAGGEFALFQSAGAPSGAHTQMGWEVEDIEATVADLRGRGVRLRGVRPPGPCNGERDRRHLRQLPEQGRCRRARSLVSGQRGQPGRDRPADPPPGLTGLRRPAFWIA